MTPPLAIEADAAGVTYQAYVLACMVYSEAASRPRREQEGIAIAAITRASMRGVSVAQLLAPDGTRGQNANGRWASTARGPSKATISVAEDALSGRLDGDWPIRPSDFFDPSGMRPEGGAPVKQGDGLVRRTAAEEIERMLAEGYSWIGPVDGVDENHTYLLARGGGPFAGAIAGIDAAAGIPGGGGSPVLVIAALILFALVLS